MEIQANDLIEVLTQQRNGALDEAAKLACIVRALQKEIEGLKSPKEEKEGKDGA